MSTYIHDLEEWPGFRWSHEKIADQLAAVSRHQGRLIGRMEGLGFQLRAEAVLASLTEEVIKSSEIEGEALDKEQVRSSIARRLGMDIGALTGDATGSGDAAKITVSMDLYDFGVPVHVVAPPTVDVTEFPWGSTGTVS